MADVPIPFYYNQFSTKERSYIDYMGDLNKSLSSEIESSADRQIAANALFTESIKSQIVDAQIATTNAMYNNTQQMIGALNSGFSGVSNQIQSGFSNVSRQIGEMGAAMSMGFAALNTAVQESSQAICDRLDTMNDILNNPSLTKTRELFRRAQVNYNKGFYEEARNDLLEALASNKTDYISWFLLGKTYLFGAGEFSTVIDLDAAVDAMKNAVKFITPDARKQLDARIMAAEMCFFLGLAQQTRALDSLHKKNEADCRNYLEQAGGSYKQSYDYSPQMLEAIYNRARCKVLLGDVPGALADLEMVVLADRNYCLKVYVDTDFSSITGQFAAMIKKLKNTAFIAAKKDYDHVKTLLAELASLGGTAKVTEPSAFTEETPFFDLLGYAKDLKQIISVVEKVIASKKLAAYQRCVSADANTVGLKTNGTVVAVGYNKNGQCNVSDWRDIIAFASSGMHTVGLKADGTVVAVGYNEYHGQCNVGAWRGIAAIAAGDMHTVGLKTNGTVVAVGKNEHGQCNVSDWRGIVAVVAYGDHTVGLKADGTVVAVGRNGHGQCNVGAWRDIVAVTITTWHTVGLKADGTVVAVGDNRHGQRNVSDWRDIVAVTAAMGHTVGLKADGTVVAVGYNKDGQCNVGDWRDIVAVVAGKDHTVGLKADGTVVAVGKNDYGQCNVGDWRDIVAIVASSHTVGLKADGTVVAVGYNESGQCNVSSWRGIGPVSKE